MRRPVTLVRKPSVLVALLAGLVGTLLLSSLLFLAPVLGFPFVDVPRLVGGVFTADPDAAFHLGFWIFFLVGWFLFAPALALLWAALPGENVGYAGGLLKGISWGLVLWLASGLLMPVLGWLNRLPEGALESPGWFALGAGVAGAMGVLLGHLAYGLAVGLICAATHGIRPLDVMGWMEYGKSKLNRAAAAGNR